MVQHSFFPNLGVAIIPNCITFHPPIQRSRDHAWKFPCPMSMLGIGTILESCLAVKAALRIVYDQISNQTLDHTMMSLIFKPLKPRMFASILVILYIQYVNRILITLSLWIFDHSGVLHANSLTSITTP